MKKIKVTIAGLSLILLFILSYQFLSHFDRYFGAIVDKLIAGGVGGGLFLLYFTSIFKKYRLYSSANLAPLVVSIILLAVALNWLVSEYINAIHVDNVLHADGIFNMLFSIIFLQIFLIIKYTFTPGEFVFYQKAFTANY